MYNTTLPLRRPKAFQKLEYGQIRLLKLFPEEEISTGQRIRCRLFSVSLSEAPNYEALSYHLG
jgi:hypothetical protein